MNNSEPLKLALVDDHRLFRKGLAKLITYIRANTFIIFEAEGGLAMMDFLKRDLVPDLIIMDVNMPDMDGFACVRWLREIYPQIPVLVLSMIAAEESILRMLRLGVKGYLSKDVEPAELSQAIENVSAGRYHYSDLVTSRIVHSIQEPGLGYFVKGAGQVVSLSAREVKFLKLICQELTYQEIASEMGLSHKTIDGYRIALFGKLSVKSRIGLVLFAVKNGIYQGEGL